MARRWQPREHRLVAEWTAAQFPGAEIRLRAHLGALDPSLEDSGLDPAELRRLGVWRRWADALVIEPAAVHLVEGKIAAKLGALEQLDVYALLVPLTPELAQVRHLPVVRHLVAAINDPLVTTLARQRGILVHEFRPAWVEEYVAELFPRERTPTQLRGLQGVLPIVEEP